MVEGRDISESLLLRQLHGIVRGVVEHAAVEDHLRAVLLGAALWEM